MEEYIMTIDEGTTSARAVLFNKDSEIIAICAKEFAQYYPQPGWVEQDPKEIWLTTKEVINRVVLQAGIDPRQIKAAGITNQRETVVVYDKNTGEPVYNAIGWADRRTAPYCDELKAAGKEQMFIDKTGLLIDGYFSGTEIKWILDNVPGAREKAEAEKLAEAGKKEPEQKQESVSQTVEEEAQEERTEENQKEKTHTIVIRVCGTGNQLNALGEFLTKNNIKYEQIQ